MNKNFPTSMIVVAAVVSFGMIGSQLDLGGLSGQAAGGECYYDEDLLWLIARAMSSTMKLAGHQRTDTYLAAMEGHPGELRPIHNGQDLVR